MTSTSPHRFHDFTLVRVALDWADGVVAFELLGPTDQITLRATGLRRLSLSREQAWGPSVSVNTFELAEEPDGGLWRGQFEMQSGDQIEVICEGFE
jgi:hypothetical protein